MENSQVVAQELQDLDGLLLDLAHRVAESPARAAEIARALAANADAFARGARRTH